MHFKFLALLLAALAPLQANLLIAKDGHSASVEKARIIGIENFTQINSNVGFAGILVGFGGATHPDALASLKERGFVSVINLRVADEENVDLESSINAAKTANLNYIHLPFDKSKLEAVPVDSFLEAVGNLENQPVYIHCSSATRAAALWMIGRVLIDGWDTESAGAEAQKIALKPEKSIAFANAYLRSIGETASN